MAADGIITSGKEEETAGPSGKEPKMSTHAPSEKGAIGGHAVKTETTSAPPQGETGADALKQPKPYSLGQNFKVWLSQFDEYLKLANIPEAKKKAFLVTLLDQTAYRAV